MIEFTVESIGGPNIDGEFQLSILAAKTGQTISRTHISEQPNFDKIEYLEDYKINKSLNNYLFMKGKVKVCYEWDETNGIEQRDIDKIQEIYSVNNLEDIHTPRTITGNSLTYEIDHGGYVTEWRERSTNYELSSHKSSITSLQDDTILICCLQEDYGYKFYNVDIQPDESIETNKIGDTTYLLVGEDCEVTVPATNRRIKWTHTFNQYDCKKLVSSKCSIKNISNNICRVVMICK